MREIKNYSWQTNGTPHTVIIIEEMEGNDLFYKVTYGNGYYGDVHEEECETIEEAEKVFDDFSKYFKNGNGFQF